MGTVRLLSWNVNGLKAIFQKEVAPGLTFPRFIETDGADIFCLQETKADPRTLPAGTYRIPGYFFYLNPAERKGYSGTGIYCRTEPDSIVMGFHPSFDNEGRTIISRYPGFTLINVYFPNGGASDERLKYKLAFYDAFLAFISDLTVRGERVIVCGDVNTAHTPDDLARPKENATVSGFLPEERAWIDRLSAAGFLDSFRMFTTGTGHYSWWDYKTRARSRNVGWRIDYFFVHESVRGAVSGASIRTGVMGSDHCPVELVLSL